ncbi:MAG: VWA domain-containing protein [Candidatus Jettenia sp.]|uniref:VWFA domain-containing protein n=1 Tax=Candidatus Jettenia caeni TaxID=247490 RepID=I3IJ98_9BACT|nr:BatA domain-containing protein [Candidatus Jettenia sp. AMX1]MBC6930582.1 VWA domain-containing protein [Candidatus Jettenia sp.]NUN24708.1 BatA domain-containing protein [Candidatus Jettenia caeni]KAA0246813.1 MAG: VWA domain-containing protein [Candidatus Jettenia sp. AMX1]MCE7882192.1 VWA domain-containing protein [Candidatus Jettenia sp. AMX1]MCQ3928749.1 VWA domain-containing protein [Candidatus Jettenia sp.]
MISFLNPLLLLGILGASIPVIIHLINKKKAISHRFAAIDFLLQTNKRISVKFKLRQLILLILRASLITFLALALAKPFLKTFGGGVSEKNVPTSNVIIVDDSYSMQYVSNSESLFASAKTAAKKIVDSLTKDDDVAIITCSGVESQALPELDYDKNTVLNLAEQLQVTFTATHITPALDAAIEILTNAKASVKRIFLLTDMTKNSWNFDWFKTGNERLQSHISGIHIVDLSKGGMLNNVAITHIESGLDISQKDGRGYIKVTVSNFSPVRVKSLLVRVFLDQKKVTQGFFNIEGNASETKEFSFTLEKGKDHEGWVEIPDDNLGIDNKRYFTMHATQKLDALLVDGDLRTNIYESETFYLEKALNPGREHISSIRPTLCSVHEVNNFHFSDFNIIFLCNIETFPYEKIRELEKFVKEGGSVIFTLGSKVDPDYYNNSFGALLPHRLHTTRTFSGDSPLSEDQPLHLKAKEPVHQALHVLSETDMNTLSSARFYRIFYVDPTPQGSSKTILSFSDDTPAVIERQIERGKCILFTSSIDRDWTDMPVKPFFLPLIQQLCRYLSGTISEETQNGILVKQSWQSPCPYDINAIEITNPEGTKITVQPQLANNEKSFHYTRTDIPGIYTLTVDGKPLPQFPSYFPVNVTTAESRLDKMEQKDITALMGGINLTITTSPIDEGREVLLGEAKKTLWGSILFLAFCILVVEAFVSRK